MTEINNININEINNKYLEDNKNEEDKSENQEEIDPNSEIVEYLLPTLEHKIIDSVVG